jgi:hypothetical protein
VKPARFNLVREVSEYRRDHPDASANAVIVALRCRRSDGLRAVRVVDELALLPGGLDGWFLKPQGGSGDRPLSVVSPEEFVTGLDSDGGS